MKTLAKMTVALTLTLGLAGFASAEVILINFGGIDSSPEAGGDGVLTNWNEAVNNGTLSAVVDSDGNTLTGVSITSSDFSGTSDNTGTYAGSGSVPSWIDLDVIEITWFDYSNGTVTISGLGSTPYDVDVVATRSTSGPNANSRQGNYLVNGAVADVGTSATWNAYDDGWELGGVMTWNNVAPDTGDIALTLNDDNNGFNVYPTAIRLTAVPEPASLALMGLGGLLMIGRRRATK